MANVIFITDPCPVCSNVSALELEASAVVAYGNGALVQKAFPNLSMDTRELILTGMHPACWDSLFPDEELSDLPVTCRLRYYHDGN